MAGEAVGRTPFGPLSETDENPLTARARFRHRHLRKWGKAILIFTPVSIFLAASIPLSSMALIGTGEIATGIVLGYLVFHVWDKDPVRMRCANSGCGKLIETNVTWICGFKQCRNEAIDEFPFVNRCQICGAEPRAYQCHHCGELIFLTVDEMKQNYARSTRPFKERSDLDIPGLETDLQKAGLELSIAKVDKEMENYIVKLESSDQKQQREQQEKAKRDYENEMSRLDEDIARNRKKAEAARQKIATQKAEEVTLPLAERAKRRWERKCEVHEIADQGRALAKEKYPEGGLQYEREMAFWDEFKEEMSVND